jgi:hypothetical protein
MRQSDRVKLHFGPCRAPYVRRGRRIMCVLRGEVLTDGMTDARIPWPIGRAGRTRSIVLCGDLEKAVERESFQAIMHWWGVSHVTVGKWRRALKVPTTNEGTRLLRIAYANSPAGKAARQKAWSKARDPVRREKIAASKRGKKRPAAVVAGMRARMLGKKLSKTTRRKMSEVHRARGTRPPKAGPVWSTEEEALLRRLPAGEVAQQTGRSLSAVYSRRSALGLNNGRTTRHRQEGT